ncbi:MAG: hypothetical protein RBQ97_11140 [Acholeplasma sp.]|nr:hypothetical protein [Acholeplasma sp.]
MKPVYEFMNFVLTDISYSRNNNDIPLTTEIKANVTNKNKNIFTLTSFVIITFSKDETSSLAFKSSYMINDLSWAGDIGEEGLTAVLFSAVYPFIREKIYNLTSDSRTPIMLPVIDLKNSNIKLGVKFERRTNV